MKITFLGTSHGVPAADRFCSSTMIEANGSRYFIDGGAPLIDILLRRGVDLDTVRAIFTTHIHGDHTNGILALADLFSWYFKTTSVDIYLTERRGIDAFSEMIRTVEGGLDEARVRFKLMTADTVYQDENIRVTPFPTQHMASAGRPAYSYLVEAEGKKALFSGDLSQRLAKGDFPAYALDNDVDLMVCEMAHFGVEEVRPYLGKCRAKTLLFNHVFPLHKLDEINALDGAFGYPIRTLNDGDEVEL
ncbi:MAG: MBL fold metallo-hydrolase [Clostridia bacterium]|nr:MBL fold metallo-hydrolase [Clostridia bacterium]MBR4442910.1 MBL fold metallo-hydrolase [Clostridia bacterium]